MKILSIVLGIVLLSTNYTLAQKSNNKLEKQKPTIVENQKNSSLNSNFKGNYQNFQRGPMYRGQFQQQKSQCPMFGFQPNKMQNFKGNFQCPRMGQQMRNRQFQCPFNNNYMPQKRHQYRGGR